MQPLATAELMRKLDHEAITHYGIPGAVLMENAGRSFVEELARAVPGLPEKSVAIVCGKGNNGGDGFVIARHLANRGNRVNVYVLAGPGGISGDARIHLEIIRRMARESPANVTIRHLRVASAFSRLRPAQILVDAIFGTGFSGIPSGVHMAAIRWMNNSGAYVASVDVPSGVHGTTGKAEGLCVRADLTVAMAFRKTGNTVGDGHEWGGALVVADIGMPANFIAKKVFDTFRVSTDDVRNVLPVRPLRAHKYSVGKVFVLAGSRSFTGAAVLCAEAALRSGAGAVVMGIPRSILEVLARKVTEVILVPLDETREGTIARSALAEVARRVAWADAVAVGPGLGRHAETDEVVRSVLDTCRAPVVLDADGINALVGALGVLKRRHAPTVLTPHAGELARLTGGSSVEIESDRIEYSRTTAKRMRSVVVLKGAPTVVASPAGPVYVNSTGNPGMATIGSGDVLTGVIAGLCAQGMGNVEAAWAGVFLHGLAGDTSAAALGERSVLAGDLLRYLPSAITTCEG